jgi:hypothetical protein
VKLLLVGLTCAWSTWRCRSPTPTSSASCCSSAVDAGDRPGADAGSFVHLALVVDEQAAPTAWFRSRTSSNRSSANRRRADSDEPPAIAAQADNSFIADARAVRRRRPRIGEDFVTGEAGEEVETLGGYLVTHVGRLPVRGEVISGPGNFEIEVPMPHPRVGRLRIATGEKRSPRARG